MKQKFKQAHIKKEIFKKKIIDLSLPRIVTTNHNYDSPSAECSFIFSTRNTKKKDLLDEKKSWADV